jgi:coenzyme PQQ precursor peptide PqqA
VGIDQRCFAAGASNPPSLAVRACTGTADGISCLLLRLAHMGPFHRPGAMIMAWTTPTLVEICIGLEINGYLPAEF